MSGQGIACADPESEGLEVSAEPMRGARYLIAIRDAQGLVGTCYARDLTTALRAAQILHGTLYVALE